MGKRHMGNQRCSICNAVSSEEIVDDCGDSYHGAFVLDADGITLTCSACMSDINDVRRDFQLDDEEKFRDEDGKLSGKMVVQSRWNNFYLRKEKVHYDKRSKTDE